MVMLGPLDIVALSPQHEQLIVGDELDHISRSMLSLALLVEPEPRLPHDFSIFHLMALIAMSSIVVRINSLKAIVSPSSSNRYSRTTI